MFYARSQSSVARLFSCRLPKTKNCTSRIFFQILLLIFLTTVSSRVNASDQSFNGLSLSPNGVEYATTHGAVQNSSTGRLLIHRHALSNTIVDVKLPNGLEPYDPEYSPDGSEILFAGNCYESIEECSPRTLGWNIYKYSLKDKAIVQLTNPNQELIRWRPAWGPEGDAYYIVMKNRGDVEAAALISASAIFRVDDNGAENAVFPKNVNGSGSQLIWHPIGKISRMHIISVSNHELVISGEIKVNTSRATRRLESSENKGLVFDNRLTSFADEHFYNNLGKAPNGRDTSDAIFIVGSNKIQNVFELPNIRQLLPDEPHVLFAEEDDGKIVFGVRNWTPLYGKPFLYNESTIHQLPNNDTLTNGQFLDFDLVASTAVFVTELKDETLVLNFFQDWKKTEEILLQTNGR